MRWSTQPARDVLSLETEGGQPEPRYPRPGRRPVRGATVDDIVVLALLFGQTSGQAGAARVSTGMATTPDGHDDGHDEGARRCFTAPRSFRKSGPARRLGATQWPVRPE